MNIDTDIWLLLSFGKKKWNRKGKFTNRKVEVKYDLEGVAKMKYIGETYHIKLCANTTGIMTIKLCQVFLETFALFYLDADKCFRQHNVILIYLSVIVLGEHRHGSKFSSPRNTYQQQIGQWYLLSGSTRSSWKVSDSLQYCFEVLLWVSVTFNTG